MKRRDIYLVLIVLASLLSYLLEGRWDTFSTIWSKEDSGFYRLTEARLLDHRGNDGDSFLMAHGDGETVFRLHFVDACETDDRFKERLRDQAKYFGRPLSYEEVMNLGEEAKAFTLVQLQQEPFEVFTRDEAVMGSHRRYAMIRFRNARSNDDRWLSQRLVRAGLARIHTKGAHLPDGTSRRIFESGLRRLESEARRERRGAWGNP